MERKAIWLTSVVSIVLFALVIVLGISWSKTPTQSATANQQSPVLITEVMSRNKTYPDPQGLLLDYIELYNSSDSPVDISGYTLSDKEDALLYTFPQGSQIPANSYLVCYCDPDGKTPGSLNFGISRDGETIFLYNNANVCVQTVAVPSLPEDQPYARNADGTFSIFDYATPGLPNTLDGYDQWLASANLTPAKVVFSEILTSNRTGILNQDGQLCDWLEIHNPTQEPADLSGYYLSNEPEQPKKWQITNLVIPAGGYALLRCTDRPESDTEIPFGLSRNGCTVTMTGPIGTFITQITCPALEPDTAWQQQADGTWLSTEKVSPGFENTAQGHQDYLATKTVTGPLMISELMPSNDRYLIQSDGRYYDWVELKNISQSSIQLSDYAISDDEDEPLMFRLPAKTLAPGEMVVIILSGNTDLTDRYIHAPFSLNKDGFYFYVSHLTDGYSDYLYVPQVTLEGSAGREGTDPQLLYYAQPSPEETNVGGFSEITQDPFVQTPGGIYNNIDQLSVVLSGEGTIYYTLDGSVPTIYSPRYVNPITLTKTTTVRAVCYGTNKLPSRVVTTGYIINENHTLPVLSISADPGQMFGGSGIYTNYTQNIEIPCNMTFYEDDGTFSIDCGIKMFGHTGLQMAKKSFKVNFRSIYGDGLLSYPVYGDDGPEVYDSLVVRSGQDYPQAIFRDELFTNLCRQMGDNVLAQRDKFCILYINGEYRGIYCIKEAFSEFYYATNRGVREESVQIIQAPVYPSEDLYPFMNYLGSHDMTDPDNYAYACTVMNMESLIDWIIIQGYSTNGDVQQNLRYFRSTDNGNTWEMAFYDLDWAFYYHLPFTDVLSNGREMNWQHLRITMRLIKNPTFRTQFLERLSYHMEHTLSVENVLATIDYYEKLLAPEVERERDRWGGSYDGWIWQVNKMRRFITEWDHMADMVNRLRMYVGLTDAEAEKYFGRWI